MTKILAISKSPSILTLSCTTAGSTTLTLADDSSFNQVYIGMIIVGDGIPSSTRITAKSTDSSRQVTLSASATDSTTANRTFEKVAYNCPTNPKFKVIETSGNALYDNFTAIYPNSFNTELQPTFTALNVTSLTGASFATTTNGGHTITVSSTSGMFVGQSIQTTLGNFPDNTTIARINSSTEIDTSEGALSTNSNATLILGQQLSNAETTSGFRLKCHSSDSSTGFNFTSTQKDEVNNKTDNHYFVLIHSDNHLKHHFAKITEVHSDDSLGDSFDFEPKLGNEIPINTKFKLYSFPIDEYIYPHAISAGIKYDLNDSLICARPLFYFFDEHLDKKGQLNHNEKYAIKFNTGLDSATVSSDSYFTTIPEFGTSVIDNSKFSMRVQLIDRLKDQDDPLIHTSNEGVTPSTFNPFTRDAAFVNIRRDSEGEDVESDLANFSTPDYTGPKRYIHYDYSPTISNATENIMDCFIEESIGARGGHAEIKIVDSSRMLSTKIKDFSPIRVRHQVHRGNFFDWMELPLKITAVSAHPEYTIKADFDISSFLTVGDEVKVGNRILIVKTIDSHSSFSQDITFEDFTRLETESEFTTTTYALSIGAIIYRRAYNQTHKTLLTDYKIIEGRTSVLYVVLGNSKLESLETSVVGSDADKKLLTLQFDNSSYSFNSSLRSAVGNYSIEVERLNGEIESIENDIENNTNIMRLVANSTSRKLTANIIDKNALFTKDIIYSSDSPYNNLTPLLDTSNNEMQAIVTFDASSKTIDLKTAANISNAATATIPAGTILFGKYSNGLLSYIGRTTVATSSSNSVAIGEYPRTEGTVTLYKSATKNYIMNKALASNSLVSSASSLDGVSNKGLYFDSGKKIRRSGVGTGTQQDGSEESTLVSSSLSNTPEARGYYLSSSTKMKSDSAFQARLDNVTHTTYADFDTINTLIDFTVVSIKKNKFDTSVVIAPYVPLTLGRVDVNYANQLDTIISTAILMTCNAIGSTPQNSLTSSLSGYHVALGGIDNPRRHYGSPIYVNGIFAGFFVGASNSGTYTTLYLDRKIKNIAANSEVTILNRLDDTLEESKKTHELNFLNAGHLHTGKMIGLLHPTIGAANTPNTNVVADNTLSLFDYPLAYEEDLGRSSYANKFGSPYYRLISLEKGNFNLVNSSITGFTESEEFNFYGEKLSKVKYYSTAYRFSPGFYVDGILNDNIIGTGVGMPNYLGSEGHDLIESRGFNSVTGSRYFNTTRFRKNSNQTTDAIYVPPNPTLYSDTSLGRSPYIAEDVLDNKDPKVSRMFLFSNCDLLPYSGSRIDSLFNTNNTRDLREYSLMLIDEPSITDSFDTKTNILGETKRITSNDSSHSFVKIKSSSKSVGSENASFTNFSLMRLTEVVYDFAFNQFDPENPPSKNRVVPSFQYATHQKNPVSSSGNAVYARSIPSSNVIRCSLSPDNLSANDVIVDSTGRFMGIVSSVSTTDITCDSAIFKTYRDSSNVAQHYVASSGTDTRLFFVPVEQLTNADSGVGPIKGHGKQDTFINFDDDIHLLKSAIMTDTTTTKYGKSGSDFYTKYNSNTLSGTINNTSREANLWLPIDIDSDSTAAKGAGGGQPSKVLESLRAGFLSSMASGNGFAASGYNYGELLYTHFMPIIFDRFNIEDGTTANADTGMCCPRVLGMSHRTVEDEFSLYGISLNGDYASLKDSGTPRGNLDTDADGIIFGFKPLLKIHNTNDLMGTDKGPNNTTIIRVKLDEEEQPFLQFVDLTGCYLAAENGKYLQTDGDSISLGTHSDGESLNGVTPNKLLYVISHEFDISDTSRTHILTLDDSLVAADTFYRILQPNHTCLYDFSPSDIKLNELSSRYTKKPYSNSVYDTPNSYFVKGGSGKRTLAGEGEAVLSMYVIADPNDVSSSDHVVIRTPDKLDAIWNIGDDNLSKQTLCIADGENSNITGVTFSKDSTTIGYYMSIAEQQTMLGIPSVSELIELKVEGEVPSSAKRAIIGSEVSICREADDLIEELLQDNNIDFSLSKNANYPFFLAPDFKGVNLFQAINFIMSKKNKSLLEVNGTLTIVDKTNTSNFPNVIIGTRNKNIDVFRVQKLKTMYSFANTVTVVGKSHKGTRKNLRSIKKVGIKSMREYDKQLITQEEVDSRATELLRLHGKFNSKIIVEVGHKGLGQLRAGDIVTLDFPKENIKFSEFLVLQLTHNMKGMITLELGRYTKQLEDRFAEIQIKQQQATEEDSEEVPNKLELSFLDDINLKLIRFVAQKRSSSDGNKLGFGSPLNTSTYTLGFVGVGGTTTTLLEEDF